MKVRVRKLGERRESQEGEGCEGAWECNWTLDNTFLESSTSFASPEGEWPCMFSTSAQKSCFESNVMHLDSLTVSVSITLKFTFIDHD